MFGFLKSKPSSSRAVVTKGNLPPYVDPRQVPTKKKPFSTIINQDFTHTVEMVLPEELYDLVWPQLAAKIDQIQYYQVIMPLSALLEGEFFNRYIKTGNILMLSEGRSGVDDKYCLKEGQLRLELAKENYERSGLLGKDIRDGGRKHVKTRYVVEIDLRQPSMLHGKKGFEKIVWAFKNVLNHSVMWLFHDIRDESDYPTGKPIDEHHPVLKTVSPEKTTVKSVLVPDLHSVNRMDSGEDLEEWALDIYEWLGLVSIVSPRIVVGDSVDPYLCRYQIPFSDTESPKIQNLTHLKWTGLLPIVWVKELFMGIYTGMKIEESCQAFMAMSAYAFRTQPIGQADSYTLLCLSGKQVAEVQSPVLQTSGDSNGGMDYVLWEIYF